ncbi:Nuclear elongation and deformation protein 1 [Lobulomyces angularis]|nr:Nuclear elongation and deformation protein 1 [Lobulomyces angularis]
MAITFPIKLYNETNAATLSGSIDIVVVENKDGELSCSPFHVRFGKLKLLRPSDKVVIIIPKILFHNFGKVEVSLNGQVLDLPMKVGDAGEAFFVIPTDEDVLSEYATSPIPSPSEMAEEPEPFSLDNFEASGFESAHEISIGEVLAEGAEGGEKKNFSPLKEIEQAAIIDKLVSFNESVEVANVPKIKKVESIDTSLVYDSINNSTMHTAKSDSVEVELIIPITEVNEGKIEEHPDEKPGKIAIDSASIVESLFEQPPNGMPLTKEEKFAENTVIKTNEILKTVSGDAKIERTITSTPPIELQNKFEDSGTDTFITKALFTSLPAEQQNLLFGGNCLPSSPLSDTEVNYSDFDFKGKKNLFGPLSDTEVDYKNVKEIKKFPAGPLSDTEVDYNETEKENSAPEQGWSWGWGGLPKKNEGQDKGVTLFNKGFNEDINKQMHFDEKVENYLAGIKKDEDSEDLSNPTFDTNPTVEVSMCGYKEIRNCETLELANQLFKNNIVSYEDVCQNPMFLMHDPNICVRISGRYYSWTAAGPILFSLLAFKKPLTASALAKIVEHEKQKDSSYSYRKAFSSWFSRPSKMNLKQNIEDLPLTAEPLQMSPSLSASPERKQKQENNSPNINIDSKLSPPVKKQNYAKAIRLSSDQLKSLNLNKGSNTITFSVYSQFQGKAECSSKIFFWGSDEKVVISDIDGTITKSDVLGHIFATIGKDWTHSGVANLYTNIYNNGYKILYLTSRAIGQATYTRDYLNKVAQDKHQLPEGPMIMSPDRLFKSFHREVILRKPEEFKIACLKDIKKLWKDNDTPFFAGFGNRITDAISYKQVDIPSSKIFTIDPTGKIKLELLNGFESSYIKLNDIVDQIFPPVNKAINEDFSDWNYWRTSLPEINLDEIIDNGVSTYANRLEEIRQEDEEEDYEDGEEELTDEDDDFSDVLLAANEVPQTF